jgi:hypothetical protein
MCLITTLSVLWKHRNDKLELDNLTNYAVSAQNTRLWE